MEENIKEELTPLQELEKEALCGDRQAVLRVVSSLRRYRAESKKLLDSRYRDGECDSLSLHEFNEEIEEIEKAGEEDD